MENRGRYIYGVADGGMAVSLGPIGIGCSEVYTIPCGHCRAIVHSCPAEPYQSTDEDVVKQWVRIHQDVLDESKKELGTVVPMGFDTILRSKNDAVPPDQVVKDWLNEDFKRLQALIKKIKGKDEYGVQIYYIPRLIAKQLSEENQQIQEIKDEMASKSPGMAYLYRQKLEKAVKVETERLASDWFKDFYVRVKRHSDDIVVDKPKRIGRDKVMLVNFSCLVAKEEVECLGEALEKINNLPGFLVHFAGPWPPYSFVANPVMPVMEEVK